MDKLIINLPRRALLYILAILVGSEATHIDCVGFFFDLYSSDSVKNPGCSVSAPPAAPSVSGLHASESLYLKKIFCGCMIALACDPCAWEAELCSLGLSRTHFTDNSNHCSKSPSQENRTT